MTKNVLLVFATLFVATVVPGWSNAQTVTTFDSTGMGESPHSELIATVESKSGGSQSIDSNDDNVLRNCLVIAGLALTFCLGMAITATTIHQNRPSSPRPTSFFAS